MNTNNLNYIKYIETYIEVVKLGCLSKAAKKLYLSQPTVSIRISLIEDELGYKLLDRRKGNFILTPEGKRFFRFAEYVFHEHKRLTQDLSQMHMEVSGKLKISTTYILGEFMLPPILNEFKEYNPSVEIKLVIREYSNEVIKGVKLGENDIGFCGVISPDPELEYITLGRDEQVLIVYPGHPFAHNKEIAASDLIGESLILRAERDRMMNLKNALLRAGFDLDQYPPKLILGTTTGMISAVASKAGIAIIPYMTIKNSEATGLIKVVKIKNLRMKRNYVCVYRKDWIMDSVSTNFIHFMKNQFKQPKSTNQNISV
jgi:DNA-binding transcriptional LysR family regulator